jgi:hypothetical protein
VTQLPTPALHHDAFSFATKTSAARTVFLLMQAASPCCNKPAPVSQMHCNAFKKQEELGQHRSIQSQQPRVTAHCTALQRMMHFCAAERAPFTSHNHSKASRTIHHLIEANKQLPRLFKPKYDQT